ncbi:MAG: hypothetical protein V3U65_12855 [Granulosicoccaceae bacterium]
MNLMIAEILACLAAASVLGLFCGWMIKAATGRRKLAQATADFDKKYVALEARSQQDIEHLEDSLQQMGDEVKTLTNSNRLLNDSLRKNEVSVYKSRTDAIELNRQQAETQERLQRIIMEKDEELGVLKNSSASAELGKAAAAAGVSAAVAAKASDILQSGANDDTNSRTDSLTAKREAWERERQSLIDTLSEDQQTIAIDKNDIPNEHLDKTIKLDNELMGGSHDSVLDTSNNDARGDDTFDRSLHEDSTIALDDIDKPIDNSLGGKQKPDKDRT